MAPAVQPIIRGVTQSETKYPRLCEMISESGIFLQNIQIYESVNAVAEKLP